MPRKPRVALTVDQQKAALDLWLAGEPTEAIARRFDIAERTARYHTLGRATPELEAVRAAALGTRHAASERALVRQARLTERQQADLQYALAWEGVCFPTDPRARADHGTPRWAFGPAPVPHPSTLSGIV